MHISKDSTPSVSIVIPTLNGERLLGSQLESLVAQVEAPPFEVLIADNGSDDGTIALAQSFDDRLDLRIVDASAHRGQAYARNVGAASARAALLLFLDQDDEVVPEYVSAMARALSASTLVAARVDIRSINPSWAHPPRRLAQEEGLAWGGPFPWGYGGTLGIRADLMSFLGGFDSRLSGGGEDEDLCWRAAILGHKCSFVPDAVLRYRLPATATDLYRQGRRYGGAQVRLDRVYRGFGYEPMAMRTSGILVMKCAVHLLAARGPDRGRWTFLIGRHLGALEAMVRREPNPVRPMAPLTRITGTPGVVVHWRQPVRCRSTVESLMEQKAIGPIVVVDNESSLGGERMPLGVEVLSVAPNLGFAGATNLGIARWLSTDAEFILVASEDCLLGVDALEQLMETACRAPDIGIVRPTHRDETGPADASGRCSLYRTNCLRSIGGLNETLGSVARNVDLFDRARKAGWRVEVDRRVVVTCQAMHDGHHDGAPPVRHTVSSRWRTHVRPSRREIPVVRLAHDVGGGMK